MNNIYRENGRTQDASYNTESYVAIKTKGSLYRDKFTSLSDGEKKVLMALLDFCDNDLNTIQVGGDVANAIEDTYSIKVKTIRNVLPKLYPIVEKTHLRGEYIINPMFAVKGNEDSVWRMYSKIESELKVLQDEYK